MYRRFGQHVPVHRVPQRFVDAHAVLVNRYALRQAQQGRGGKAAILNIRLQRVVLGIVVGDAGQVVSQVIGYVQALRALDVFRTGGLHPVRYFFFRQPRPVAGGSDTDNHHLFDDFLPDGCRGQRATGD